jgi:flagellar basal body rod protein FlgC
LRIRSIEKTPEMEQMVSMISITGGYEANATAPKTAKDVALKALKRGR